MLDVLVVGAGPTGLAMACELARHGVSCRIIDELAAPSDKSKAIGVHARTLEVFAHMGIVDRALELGKPVHGANAYAGGKRIVHIGFDDVDSPYPFVLSLPQSVTEQVLSELLARHALTVDRGVKLTSLAQDGDGVTATLVREGSGEETLRARWIVGCDGSHSAVRKALGVPFEGRAYDEAFALADVAIDWSLPDDEMHTFLSPDGVVGAIPMPGTRRYRVVMDRSREAPDTTPTLADFERAFTARGAGDVRLRDAGWIAPFRIHRRIVPRYRVGRVFLAGDAAHIHSPAGGQGMNTGIQDAYNLGWKLALVARGFGRSELLDSYEPERRPIAAATIEGTDAATRVVSLRNPVAREVRDRLAGFLSSLEAVQRRIVDRVSEVGLGYRASPLVREDRASVVRASVVADRTTELPSVGDWLDFGAAPRAGDRAPNCILDPDGDGSCAFDLLHGNRHVLLLFDGAAATAAGYASLAAIAASVRARHGEHVDVHVVVPHEDKPTELAGEGAVILDRLGAFHRRYGAGAECIYLVRPDGYVAYRAQPANGDRLAAFLATIFS